MDNYRDRWLLLVVVGADEAGNVERWPDGSIPGTPAVNPDVIDCTISEVSDYALKAPNWQRFYIAGTPAPDTAVTPTFWHNNYLDVLPWLRTIDTDDPREERFGSVIPAPSDRSTYRVEAQFLISVSRVAVENGGNTVFLWELERDGIVVASGQLTNPAQNPLQLPEDFDPAGVDNVYDAARLTDSATGEVRLDSWPGTARREPINYVFRAAAWVDDPAEGTVGVVDPGERDPTPANVLFTVVPGTSVESYIAPHVSEDEQPVKSQENL